jgi:hypothetical protein
MKNEKKFKKNVKEDFAGEIMSYLKIFEGNMGQDAKNYEMHKLHLKIVREICDSDEYIYGYDLPDEKDVYSLIKDCINEEHAEIYI